MTTHLRTPPASDHPPTSPATQTAASPNHSSRPPASNSDRLTLWERVSFGLTHWAVSCLLWLLGARGLYRLGRAFGWMEWLLHARRRKRFARAYSLIAGSQAPPAQQRRACREHFMRTRCDKLIYLIFDRLPRQKAAQLLAIENYDLLDQAVRRGCGVYLALIHQSSLHVVGMLLALRGYKTAGVRDRNESALRRYVQQRLDEKYPEFARTRMIFADAFPREIYRCFHDGYLLGSAIDVSRVRGNHQRTEEVSVFGQKHHFLAGPIRAARRCGATVFQAFMLPQHDFRYTLQIAEMLLDPDSPLDEDAAVKSAINRYAANLEAFLKAHPELMTKT